MQKVAMREEDLRARYRHLCEIEAQPIIVPAEHGLWVVDSTSPEQIDAFRGNVFSMEGINGSGKKTQSWWLRDGLRALGLEAEVVSFPFYDNETGFTVFCYLNNGKKDFRGDPIEDPKWWYEQNRIEETPKIKAVLSKGGVVIYDRGADSNKAHQGAELENKENLDELINHVNQVEYMVNRFPRPDLTFHLSGDPFVINGKLTEKASVSGIPMDEHEKKIQHQMRAEEIYQMVADIESDHWATVRCTESNGYRSIETIAREVYAHTLSRLEKQ